MKNLACYLPVLIKQQQISRVLCRKNIEYCGIDSIQPILDTQAMKSTKVSRSRSSWKVVNISYPFTKNVTQDST